MASFDVRSWLASAGEEKRHVKVSQPAHNQYCATDVLLSEYRKETAVLETQGKLCLISIGPLLKATSTSNQTSNPVLQRERCANVLLYIRTRNQALLTKGVSPRSESARSSVGSARRQIR